MKQKKKTRQFDISIQVFALKRLNMIEMWSRPTRLDPSFNSRHDFGILINLSNSFLHKMECDFHAGSLTSLTTYCQLSDCITKVLHFDRFLCGDKIQLVQDDLPCPAGNSPSDVSNHVFFDSEQTAMHLVSKGNLLVSFIDLLTRHQPLRS